MLDAAKATQESKVPAGVKQKATADSTPATEKKDTGYESEEDENMKLLKASHKRSLKSMSAAARIQLDNEREKVIEAYRAKKVKKNTGY